MQIVLTQDEIATIVAKHLKAQGKKAINIRYRFDYETTAGSPQRRRGESKSVSEEIFGPSLVHPTVKHKGFTCEIEIEETN